MIFTSSGGATVVSLPGTAFNVEHPNLEHWENRHEMQDGSVIVYDHAVTAYWIKVDFNLSEVQRSALRSFFHTTTQYGKFAFKVTPDATIDLGKGAGVQLTDVRLWSGGFPEKPIAPGRFAVSLVLRTHSTGTGNPA